MSSFKISEEVKNKKSKIYRSRFLWHSDSHKIYRPSSLHNLDPHGDVLGPIELLFGLTNGQWYNTALQILNLIVCVYNVDARALR